jgi:hypothetical protein
MNLDRVVDRFRGDGKSPFKPYRLSTLFLFPNKFRKDTVICVICVTASRNHLINKALQNYARKCFCVTDRHLPSPYRHRRRQSRRILRHPNGVLRHLPSPAQASYASLELSFLDSEASPVLARWMLSLARCRDLREPDPLPPIPMELKFANRRDYQWSWQSWHQTEAALEANIH